jgi:hypothetical protein
MGDEPHVTGVLLTASDETARGRLTQREIGSALDWHVERSRQRAQELNDLTPPWIHRLSTDGRTVTEIADEAIVLTGWLTGE